MVTFITLSIEMAYDEDGLEAAQNKYRAYFIKEKNAKKYAKYKAGVDADLTKDGYAECIVKE